MELAGSGRRRYAGGMSPAGASRRGARSAIDSIDEIATVRIELVDTDPPIWREVEVPTSITLKVLHDVVQTVMGWFDYHLWAFTIGTQRYGLPADEDDGWGHEPPADATKVRQRDVLRSRKTVIGYLYDFGDGWEHRLTVTNIRAGEPATSYPRHVGDERNAPPEDCGGIPGFYHMPDALADPNHTDHAEVAAWLDEYDPDAIDELPIKCALSRIANRRNAATARLAKAKRT